MPTPPSEVESAADDHLPPPPVPVLPLALLVWVIAFAVSSVALAAVADPGTAFEDLDGGQIFAATLPLQLALVIGSFAIVAPHRAVLRRLRLDEWEPRELAVSFMMGVGLQLAIGLAYWPVLRLLDRDLDAAQELADSFQGNELILLVLLTTLGAPIAEEIFYRGLIQGSLERSGRHWRPILITAALFATSHFQFLEWFGLFAFGAVAGWWCHRTGRVSSAIVLHMGFNALTVTTLIATQL